MKMDGFASPIKSQMQKTNSTKNENTKKGQRQIYIDGERHRDDEKRYRPAVAYV